MRRKTKKAKASRKQARQQRAKRAETGAQSNQTGTATQTGPDFWTQKRKTQYIFRTKLVRCFYGLTESYTVKVYEGFNDVNELEESRSIYKYIKARDESFWPDILPFDDELHYIWMDVSAGLPLYEASGFKTLHDVIDYFEEGSELEHAKAKELTTRRYFPFASEIRTEPLPWEEPSDQVKESSECLEDIAMKTNWDLFYKNK